MRYDACIIGAGAEGLACAAWLAARGLKVVVAERAARPGGRCTTREFSPGFHASPFCDELPAIPDALFRAFDLARRGAILSRGVRSPADAVREAVIARVMSDADTPSSRGWFRRPAESPPWPGEELVRRRLAEFTTTGDPPLIALSDPDLPGSAMVRLAGPPGGLPAGGLGRLGKALQTAAQEAGAEISCGLEVTDVRRRGGRVVSVGLADGGEIVARAVVSTLDLKRTFLSLFAWNELPKAVVESVRAFQAAPGIARLLVALDAPLELSGPPRRPIVLPGAAEAAYRAWRAGVVPDRPPAVVRLVSAVDPFLAPDGAAALTVTLGAIPHCPFDGTWTHEKRRRLRDTAVAIVEEALPGASAKMHAAELIVPPDIESQLGLSEGDLAGGELSPAQMLSFRPFPGFRGTRTPVDGLYLAGPSSALGPLATCASGVAAARAVIADMAAGRLR